MGSIREGNRHLSTADLGVTSDVLNPEPRVALFIDGGNLSRGIDELGIREGQEDLDFEKLLEWAKSGGADLTFASYYFNGRKLLPPTKETRKFLGKLISLGITTISVFEDQSHSIGSVMAKDMVSQIPHYDRAILMSTKDSFEQTIKQVTEERKKVTIVSPYAHIPQPILDSGVEILFLADIISGMTMRRIPIPQRLEMEAGDVTEGLVHAPEASLTENTPLVVAPTAFQA